MSTAANARESRRRVRVAATALATLAAVAVFLGGTNTPWSSSEPKSTVVTANILASAWIDTDGCATGATPNLMDFGVLVAGTKNVLGSDCTIGFGASNETASLSVYQQDGLGRAMYKPTEGDLPTSDWDEGGDADQVVETEFNAFCACQGQNVLELPTGEVVLVGAGGGLNGGIAKFDTDGTPLWERNTNFSGDDVFYGVTQQPDGKLLAVGQASSNSGDIAIARYSLGSGALDTTSDADPAVHWSTDGKQTVDVGSGSVDSGGEAFVNDDGTVLVVAESAGNTALVRLSSDGSLDTTFGTGGKVTVSLGGTEVIMDAVQQPDGKVVVVGYIDAANDNLLTARFNLDGSLDTTSDADPSVSWNTTGYRIVDIGGGDETISQAALQPDGKVVVVGWRNDDWFIGRFNSDGSWDTNSDADPTVHFSTNGWDTYNGGECCEGAWAVGVEESGSILAAGQLDTGGTGNYEVAFARWSASGSRDTTFYHGAGQTTFNIGNDWQEAPARGYMGADGSFYVAATEGDDDGGLGLAAAAVKIVATPIDNYVDDGSADWDTPSTTIDLFGACLRDAANGALTNGSTWSEDGDGTCNFVDSDPWSALPEDASAPPLAYANADTQGGSDPTVQIRFGMRTADAQQTGAYSARLVFEVIAPSLV